MSYIVDKIIRAKRTMLNANKQWCVKTMFTSAAILWTGAVSLVMEIHVFSLKVSSKVYLLSVFFTLGFMAIWTINMFIVQLYLIPSLNYHSTVSSAHKHTPMLLLHVSTLQSCDINSYSWRRINLTYFLQIQFTIDKYDQRLSSRDNKNISLEWAFSHVDKKWETMASKPRLQCTLHMRFNMRLIRHRETVR